ncbi:MAG: cyclic nucleotide-binding domain-containing protein [Chlamydiales bacterium]
MGLNTHMVDSITVLCEIIILISYFCRNMLALRLVSMMGSLGFILVGFLAGYSLPGMTPLIFFNILIVIINGIQASLIITERLPAILPEHLRNLYLTVFRLLTTNEFLKILKLSEEITLNKGCILIVENQLVPKLLLITDGTVKITKKNALGIELPQGYFIGEMSYLTGKPANATVEVTSDHVSCFAWDKGLLDKLKDKDHDLFSKLEQSIAVNLIKKIERQMPS